MRTYLIVGLGNPGERYASTRHNLGIRVVRAWVEVQRASGTALVRNWAAVGDVPADVAVIEVAGQWRALAVFPQTGMNESGSAVAYLARRDGLSVDRVLVVHDDIELPLGIVREVSGGSAKGHNGMRSVQQALGTENVARVRVGIGRPTGGPDPAQFVLSPFAAVEQAAVQSASDQAVAAVSQWITERALALG